MEIIEKFLSSGIVFVLAAAAGSLLHLVDLNQSRKQPFYGQIEKIALFRDRYKYLNVFKNGVFSYGAILASIWIFVLSGNSQLRSGMTVLNLGFAVLSMIQVFLNRSLMRKARVKQTDWLKNLHDKLNSGVSRDSLIDLKPPSVLWNRFDRTRYELFGWIFFVHPNDRPTNDEMLAAGRILRERIVNLAGEPPTKWFPE